LVKSFVQAYATKMRPCPEELAVNSWQLAIPDRIAVANHKLPTENQLNIPDENSGKNY
jgi:hypothetical protein